MQKLDEFTGITDCRMNQFFQSLGYQKDGHVYRSRCADGRRILLLQAGVLICDTKIHAGKGGISSSWNPVTPDAREQWCSLFHPREGGSVEQFDTLVIPIIFAYSSLNGKSMEGKDGSGFRGADPAHTALIIYERGQPSSFYLDVNVYRDDRGNVIFWGKYWERIRSNIAPYLRNEIGMPFPQPKKYPVSSGPKIMYSCALMAMYFVDALLQTPLFAVPDPYSKVGFYFRLAIFGRRVIKYFKDRHIVLHRDTLVNVEESPFCMAVDEELV